jgi:hypothetical protein
MRRRERIGGNRRRDDQEEAEGGGSAPGGDRPGAVQCVPRHRQLAFTALHDRHGRAKGVLPGQ